MQAPEEADAPGRKPKANSHGYQLTTVSKTVDGQAVDFPAYVQRPESGGMMVKGYTPGNEILFYTTAAKGYKEMWDNSTEEYKQLLHTMSEARKERRHTERIAKEIVEQGLPKSESLLRTALDSYCAKMNAAIREHIAQGHSLPYDFVRMEFNIQKGQLGETHVLGPQPTQEDLDRVKSYSSKIDPATKELLYDIAYIRVDKVLSLTPETIQRKAEEAALTGTPNLAASGEHRENIYQAWAPLGDLNFPTAKYSLMNDFFFHMLAMGMEHVDYLKFEEKKMHAEQERNKITEGVKDIEEIFNLKVEKGGLNQDV